MGTLLLFIALILSSASAQSIFRTSLLDGSGEKVTVRIGVPTDFGPRFIVVTGAAYSADQILEHEQTLADGTHLRENETVQRLTRDSEGRVRIERSLPRGGPAKTPMLVEVHDPFAGYAYILDEQNKIAHRVAIPPPGVANRPVMKRRSPPSPGAQKDGPEISDEDLGTQTIEGVVVKGTRRTTTWPIGSRRGNDRPFVETSESWYSQELKLFMLTKSSSPATGNNITRFKNFSRAEPDPSLFQPTGYTAADEKDFFEMGLNRP